jgi:hypothetical protein
VQSVLRIWGGKKRIWGESKEKAIKETHFWTLIHSSKHLSIRKAIQQKAKKLENLCSSTAL